jgi:hypothetical protein
MPVTAVTSIDTRGVDVTHLAWRNRRELVFTGLRGLNRGRRG